MANERNKGNEMALAVLIREIMHVPESSPCFLCTTTTAARSAFGLKPNQISYRQAIMHWN